MKKICIIQTGLLGDTLICLPIAKYYKDLNCDVDWIIYADYANVFRNIEYINKLIIVPNTIDITDSLLYTYNNIDLSIYDKIIDLSICFKHSRVNKYCTSEIPNLKNFVETKYYLADVDINITNNLTFKRNILKEKELFNFLNIKEDYILTHGETSKGKMKIFNSNKYRIIEMSKILDYNIFDWFYVIKNAKEIHCVDSALCNFVERIFTNCPKYMYNTKERPGNIWSSARLINDWIFINDF
jgi:hypothetical protein